MARVSATAIAKDIRSLEIGEVCELGEWLHKYMRLELENPRLTNSDLLLDVLVRSSREYEGDFGVFGESEL